VLSLFDHPNIVKLLDVSLEDDHKFFVMEYIEGITLKKHISTKGKLNEDEILFLSRPILSALGEVHSKGVVHSDIKPQNVVLVGSGEIKLMDFGISKRLSAQNSEPSKTTMGTVQYVSPEQAEGKPLSHLSDIYSFGVMLYEMATGTLPFTDEDSGRIAAMHVSSSPIPPSMILPSVSPSLDAVILHAMEKDPAARPFSASELLEELESKKLPPAQEPEPIDVSDKRALLVAYIKGIYKKLHLPSCLMGILCALFLCVVVSLTCLFWALSRQEKEQTYLRAPDLVGEYYASTEALGLDSKSYHISVEYVSFPSMGGTILSQSPAPNKRVRRGNEPLEIKLTVARYAMPKQMPNVTCLTEEDARAFLARYDCEITTVYAPHAYLPQGYVYASEPTAGERATKKITLYISANE
jgi:serine/threonine-protein kinase